MRLPGRASIVLGGRGAGRLAAGLAAVLAFCWLLPGQARGQCAPPDPMDPSMIECSGDDPDGFDAMMDNDVTVTVLDGATVSNGPNTDSIRLNDGSTIITGFVGTVNNDAPMGAAASVENDGSVVHNGMINVSGDGGIGIRGLDRNTLGTGSFSRIILDAPNTTGIWAMDGAPEMMDGTPEMPGVVIHSGSISGAATGSVGIRVGSINAVSIFGDITLEGDAVTGVLLSGNDNTLANLGFITLTGTDSVGVLAGAGAEGNTVTNLGSIATGPGVGAAVDFASSGPGGMDIFNTFANFGSVTADSGTALLGGVGKEVVELVQGSTLTGLVDLGDGDDDLLLEGGTFTSADGGLGSDLLQLGPGLGGPQVLDLPSVMGFETLDLVGGDWTLSCAMPPCAGSFSAGATLTDGIARFAAPVSLTTDLLVAADAMAGTASTLEVADTLSLSGSYTQQTGSTLRVVLDPGGASGRVAASGAADIQAGAVLEIFEATPFGDTESFTLLTASGITGGFGAPPPDTAVLSFALSMPTPQEIVLDVVRSPYASAASTANQRAVGVALDAVREGGGAGSDMQLLLTSLDQTSPAAYGSALDSLHGEAYDAHTSSALWLGRSFAKLAARNVVECEPAYYRQVPSWIGEGRPCDEEGWTPWFGSFGGFRQREAGSGHVEYSGQGAGFAVGAGRSLGGGWEVAGYMGAGFGWLDVDGLGNGEIQLLDLGLATVRRIGAVTVRSVLDYGHGWHEQDRQVAAGSLVRTATGSFQSDRVTGLLEASYGLPEAGPLVIEPVASVDFSWLREEGFTESGAQSANLVVDERSHTVVGTTLGLRLQATLVKHRYILERIQWANGVWRPEIDLRWRGDWTDVNRDLSDRLLGAPSGSGSFSVDAEDTGQGAELAVGVTFQPYGTQALVSAGYRGFIGDGAQDHALGLDVRIPF